jgi:hypothetical protein
MNEKEPEEADALKLKASMSSIESISSGIARINSTYLDIFEDEPPNLVIVRYNDKQKTIKLVADRLAEMGKIILRKDDMDDIKVKDGEEVDILPYTNLTDDLKKKWKHFKERFSKPDEEVEEEEK